MRKTGIAILPLHYGKTPRWLFERMRKLAKAIATVIVDEYGSEELLRRISDPFWFQALSCTLGFDWHSSGTTTVTCGALKEALREAQLEVAIAGGKGKTAMRTPNEIEKAADSLNLPDKKIVQLQYDSRMSAKVDNAALQDLHQIYHHAFIFTAKGKWAVVQQGLDSVNKTARRYHWLSEHVKSFVNEPHDAVLSEIRHKKVLDMTARQSEEARKVSTDLAKEKPQKIKKLLSSIKPSYQRSLSEWIKSLKQKKPKEAKAEIKILDLPRKINWNLMSKVYEFQPKNFEELLAFKGVGPTTIRALALIADLIYGAEPSWRDPVRYSFAVGGKDGVPFPVNKQVMDKSIGVLETGIKEARLGSGEKLNALKRLRYFVKPLYC